MYSKEFELALKFVLEREGGYVNDPDDKGGATNKGITQNTYNSWLKSVGKPAKDVKNITDAEVKEIYHRRYWMAAKCDTMSKKFAVACFDSAVNHGVGKVSDFLKAAKWNDINLFFIARIRYYNDLVTDRPVNIKYLHGWLNRVYALFDFIGKL